MFQKISNFLRGISVNKYSGTGTVIAMVSFAIYLLFELLQITGLLKNAFIALIAYLAFPTLFFIGIILIISGWIILRKVQGKISDKILNRHLSASEIAPGIFGSKFSRTLFLAGIISIIFFVTATLRMLTYMDRTYFCGNACHTIMNPEWEVYQNSPHARVKCVDCHVGYGLQPLIESKINGMRQMILATFDAYSQPIPTPVHQLRPARETCEKCHWPSKFYGTKIKKKVHFKTDSVSTPVYTTLAIKIDEHSGTGKAGIHWHIAPENEIR